MSKAASVLLVIAVFLAPLFGGQVSVNPLPSPIPWLSGLRGPEFPITGQAITGLLALGALALAYASRKVVQLPNPWTSLPLLGFFVAITFSVFISAFRYTSILAWTQWVTAIAAMLAVVAIAGRDRGPRILLAVLTAGTTLIAIEGILEYGSMRQIDPTWRIFGSWVNPNALAGMLLLGLFVGLALCIAEEDRLAKLASGVGVVLIGLALALTQSRGGILAALVGVIVFAGLIAGLRQTRKGLAAIAPLVFVALLAFAVQAANVARPTEGTPAAASLSRVGDLGSTAEQTAGYRQLLWRGAVDLIQSNPFGYGLGTYRFESARSGLHPQTHFAHQGFLQIGVEAGILGLIMWLAFAVLWVWSVSRGWRQLSDQRSVLLVGVMAAVVACGAHNLFDSDWQHFGIGFSFFVLLGLGIQLAADGGTPEFAPKQFRLGLVFAPMVLAIVGWVLPSVGEQYRAMALASAQTQDVQAGRANLEMAMRFAPLDPDARRLAASFEPDAAQRYLREAVELGPNTRNLRALARALIAGNQPAEAIRVLRTALQRDPQNLLTRMMLVDIERQNGDLAAVRKETEALIAVEDTSYFKIRALPQLVPTQTYEARWILANMLPKGPERLSLIRAAVLGLAEYATKTLPNALAAEKQGIPEYAGESTQEARRKFQLGQEALAELERDAPSDPEIPALREIFNRSL